MTISTDFSGILAGVDASTAVTAIVAAASVFALVGFSMWASRKVGKFFDTDSGWSTADQDRYGHWYEHNSDELGVRYYYEGPNAGQGVHATNDRADAYEAYRK